MTCSHPHGVEISIHTSFVEMYPVSQQGSALWTVEAIKPPHYYLRVPEVPYRIFKHQIKKMSVREIVFGSSGFPDTASPVLHNGC